MTKAEDSDTLMYVSGMGAFLNRWFTSYEQARASLDSEGGYLFPYKNQFFVTEEEAIRELEMDPKDPDWELIGRDWVRPLNLEAWSRLKLKRMLKR